MANQEQAISNDPSKVQTVAIDHVRYWPIEATIWQTDRPESPHPRFSITISKSYKVQQDEGQAVQYESTNFVDENLAPLAAKAFADAHTRIQALKARQRGENAQAKAETLSSVESGQLPPVPAENEAAGDDPF